jgi:hypothetical protein
MPNSPAEQSDRPLASLAPEEASASVAPFEVRTPVVRIGQGPRNDLVIDDDTVSTQHARLEYSDGSWRLLDLDSKNGTYVDGVRLAPQVPTPLADSAVLGFGAIRFGFASRPDADPEEIVAAYRAEEPRTGSTVRRAGFRLPVWLVVLVLIFMATLVFLFFWFGGDPQMAVPAGEPLSSWPDPDHLPLAA